MDHIDKDGLWYVTVGLVRETPCDSASGTTAMKLIRSRTGTTILGNRVPDRWDVRMYGLRWIELRQQIPYQGTDSLNRVHSSMHANTQAPCRMAGTTT